MTPDPNPSKPAVETRFGFVAVIGATNAGKSTLVNTLVGTKVTIVSHKVQTTRMPVRGIAIEGASQLVFVDTPGIFAPRRRLDRAMVNAAWSGAADADVVVLMIDAARGIGEDVDQIVARLAETKGPKILVLNKIDRLEAKDLLLGQIARLSQQVSIAAPGQVPTKAVDAIFMVSALNGDGVPELRAHLAKTVPAGPWHYAADDITDLPLRMLASEITREKVFDRLHQELPYSITVETAQWKELRDGSVRIEQTLYVEREGQKKIVIGKGGQVIKQISSEARAELAEIVERNVHLFLFVKVREKWGEDPERYSEMGLEFPKK